jgi:hypothetical protein
VAKSAVGFNLLCTAVDASVGSYRSGAMSPRYAILDAVVDFDGPHEITDGIDMIRDDINQLKA